jgi:hypothetical protein
MRSVNSNKIITKGSAVMLCGVVMALGANANASVVLNFNNLTMTNTTGNPAYIMGQPAGMLIGTLTSVQANFVLNSQTGGVWSSDLGIFVTPQNSVQLAANGGAGVYQAGGFNNWGSTQYSAWGTGNSGVAGTPTSTTLNLATPITFNGNASDPNVFISHLWNSNSTGNWSGSITLHGVEVVPEPASMALLSAGFGAVVLRRRRKANASK